MIKPDEIAENLQKYIDILPEKYTSHLKKGSIVWKGTGIYYKIDDPKIHEKLDNFELGKVPHKAIYEKFKSLLFTSIPNRNKEFDYMERLGKKEDGKIIVPFSKVFELEKGECVERSILTQLSAQEKRESYLLSGFLKDGDKEINIQNSHTFNVVIKDKIPYLVDTMNPVRWNGKYRPFIVPIVGISNGEFILPKEWKTGRTYYTC
jgi:hypothetical protein